MSDGNELNDSSDDDSNSIISEEIRKAAQEIVLNSLPDKSKRVYTKAYNEFKKWCKQHGTNSFHEDVLLVYFSQLSTRYKPSSLWSTFSMLKTTIKAYNRVDIKGYDKLLSFLDKQSKGYRPKKSPIFSKEDVAKFINEADDRKYLCDKVILIFGIAGALRREEFVNINKSDVKVLKDEKVLLIKIDKTKNNVPRSFTISGELYDLCMKYINLRPDLCSEDRFFLRYSDGKCCKQGMGINKFGGMPREIADYLGLSNASDFTGHSFRRTSATLLVDAGADLTTLMRHGGWKSSTVATGYIADSLNNKKKIFEQISTGISIKKKKETVISHEAKSSNNLTLEVVTASKDTSNSKVDIPSNPNQIEELDISFVEESDFTEPFETRQHADSIKSKQIDKEETEKRKNNISTVDNIKKDIATQTLQISLDELEKIKKDIAVQTDVCEKGFHQNLHIQLSELKFPVSYHPDFGLYGLTDQNVNNSLVFNNCSVKIDSSCL